MKYKDKKWNVLNESYDTQMQAWLNSKKDGEVLNKYQFPEFPTQQDLNLDTFVERLEQIIKETENTVNFLLLIEDKNYDNFYHQMELETGKVNKFFYPLSHLKSVKDNKEIREVYSKCLPILSEYSSNFGQNEDLCLAIKEIYEKEQDPIRKKILKDSITGFKLSGIGLDEVTKNRIKTINARLSDLSDDFNNNLLEATNSFSIKVNESDIEGMPSDLSERAKNESGEYEFTLHVPSYNAYMEHGINRKIREDLYRAYVTKADKENEPILEEILKLNHEKAILLGYDNYAQVSLETKMVDTPNKVIEFLTSLGNKSKAMGQLELKELQDFSKQTLEAHDTAFYTTKLLKENYNFDEDLYKPYFELENTVNGMFRVLYKMFDLVFKKVEDTKIWDQRVTVYDVYKHDMKISRIYLDLENRKDKNAGAWMNYWHSRGLDENDNVILPIAFIVCNFTSAMKDKPSLLTPYEVVTLFHEMGHVLQHICYEGNELACSGINGIEWDAVEWSSQFLESLVYDKEILKMFAQHYKTGETLSEDMIDKMIEQKNFHSAWSVLGQIVYSLFDMSIYSNEEPLNAQQVQEKLDQIRSEYSLMKVPEYNKFQCGFSHIFSGGYDAGYYSYKWAEVLSSDCHLKFVNEGFFNKDLCNSYYQNFLSKGSEIPSMDMFKSFMGREPKEDSLLEYLGIK